MFKEISFKEMFQLTFTHQESHIQAHGGPLSALRSKMARQAAAGRAHRGVQVFAFEDAKERPCVARAAARVRLHLAGSASCRKQVFFTPNVRGKACTMVRGRGHRRERVPCEYAEALACAHARGDVRRTAGSASELCQGAACRESVCRRLHLAACAMGSRRVARQHQRTGTPLGACDSFRRPALRSC